MRLAMSCTTAADRCRVTVFQCRSIKTNATTDCSITIGTIMIRSARAWSPVGIQLLKAFPIQPLAAETRRDAVRIKVRPVSSVLIGQDSFDRVHLTAILVTAISGIHGDA